MRVGVVAAWGAGLASIGIGAAFLTAGLGGSAGKPKIQGLMETCPPAVSIAPRGPGQPTDDILGVRLGFTISDVTATLKCVDESYKVRFESVWHTMERGAATNQRQLLYAERTRESVAVGFIGAPGQERAAALWRTLRYEAREAPTLVAAEAELTRHFGPPQQATSTSVRRILVWAYDPNGLPIKSAPDGSSAGGVFKRVGDWIAGAITIPQCAEHLKGSPLDRPEFDAQCGLTVRAEIEADLQAPTKVAAVKIALADQARAKAQIEAYRGTLEKR